MQIRVGSGREISRCEKMDFRRQKDGEEHDEAVSYNTTIRESSFSKPLLPSSSSLLPAGRGDAIDGGGGDQNGGFRSDQSSGSVRLASPDLSPATGGNGSNSRDMAVSTGHPPAVRYRICLRNHAASLGGHVLDGCGEFMPAAVDAMKCAACGCHRSFHRRDGESDLILYRKHHRNGSDLSGGGGAAGGRIPLLLPSPHTVPQQKHIHSFQVSPSAAIFGNNSGGTTTDSSSEELGLEAADGTGSVHRPFSAPSSSKKRFRTKFTAEQKVRMVEFAEKIGWRIQRQDEAEMERFCGEAGVSRQVFKVWMHNNKHPLRKQQQQLQEQPHKQQQEQQQQGQDL